MKTISEDLKIRFAQGQCSDDELVTVLEWIEDDPANAREIFELEQTSITAQSACNPDSTTSLYERIQRQIMTDSLREQQRNRRRLILRWSAAAAVLLTLVSCVWLWMRNPAVATITVTAQAQSKSVVLPDGSKVWLAAHSTLTYPEHFAETSRGVTLNGQAYFDVTHDTARPFSVSGSQLSVTVLGTQFNMVSEAKADNSVSLIEGSVEVSTHGHKNCIVLRPGQKAVYSVKDGKLGIFDTNVKLDAVWRDRIIPFDGATVSDIASDLTYLYGCKVSVASNVNSTATYSGAVHMHRNIDSTMIELSHALPISWRKSGNNVTINGLE